MTESRTEVASPCVRICRLDSVDRCEGCLRTLQEIMAWPNLTNEQKSAVLEKVAERREALDRREEA
ncbi:MAG: DUF1289 domain-containing protein [Armatimonadetes bacterium]|nr:DUF1289 domain-containing protein [Armatimonadota bacterium]